MAPISGIHEDHPCAACNVGQESPLTDKKRDACRYYQTGSCRRGSNCPFAHFSVPSPMESSTTPHPVYQVEQVYAYPLGQTPAYHPLGLQAQPTFLWQPYLPYSPSFDPQYGPVCQAEAFLDYPDDTSDPSSAESSSAATSRDYQLCMSLDTAWFDGVRRDGTSPHYAGYGGPGFPVGRSPATPERHPVPGSTVPSSRPCSLPWQEEMKRKPLAYKTKPCKFYAKNGKCTSGEKCTFIHDSEFKGHADRSPTEPMLPVTDASLPPKPLNKYEVCRAKGFYPITWRVIGGGVMMGGHRKQCPAFVAGHCRYGDDCPLAHETELETDRVGFIELKNEAFQSGQGSVARSGKGTRSSSQRRKPIKVSCVETQQSETEIFSPTVPDLQRSEVTSETAGEKEAGVVGLSARDGPTSPMHRRTQSMSMVVGSPPPLDKTHPSYAAEL